MTESVNLSDLWYKDPKELPEFVWYESCVYKVTNIITNKIYVGITINSLIGRFRYQGFSHLSAYKEYDNRYIYNSIRKHSPINFEVNILDYNLANLKLLKEREIYWIDKLGSYYKCTPGGYNLTKGGDDCSNLHTEEVRKKATETNRRNHGGVLAFNTEESYKTKLELYGSIMGPCHTHEAELKAMNTRYERYGDPAWNMRTKESRDKAGNSISKTSLLKSISSIKLTILNAINSGLDKNFIFSRNYNDYKVEGAPQYHCWYIPNFFERCIKHNTPEDDLKFIVPHFRKDWVPEELHKYYDENYERNYLISIENAPKEVHPIQRMNSFYKTLNFLKSTIDNSLSNLPDNFVYESRSQYCTYKIPGAPKYQSSCILEFFNKCIEFKISDEELKYIVPHFRKDWVPEELYKYYNQ